MEKSSAIVGKNGVYVIDEDGVKIIAKDECVKGKIKIGKKFIDAIKEAIDKQKNKEK